MAAKESRWTAERVLALAPDPASARAGRGLAGVGKWANLGQRGSNLLWGECQGSGSQPYQTKVLPDEGATSCSCPSRKFPCKHALGLLLMWANSPSSLAALDPPPWVASWVESRANKAEAKQAKADAPPSPTDLASKAKREAARISKVTAGLEDLDLWLGDLVRSGFATLGSRPRNLWDEQARRLVDAQCPGVARRIRQVDAMSFAGDGWQTALLDRLAQTHLLIEGWRHREQLPPDVLADVRTAIGFPVDMDAVRRGALGTPIRDRWLILGQTFTVEDRITTRRVSLRGEDSKRTAQGLDFSTMGKPFESSFEPGTRVDATLGFLPGGAPLRALLIERHAPAEFIVRLDGGLAIAEAQAAFGSVLARSPWTELMPVVLAGVRLEWLDDVWWAVDTAGAALPLAKEFDRNWQVEAVAGVEPITLAAEFDGATLRPLGALAAGHYIRFTATASPDPDRVRVGAGGPGRWLTPATGVLTGATAAAVLGVDRKSPPAVPPDHPLGATAAALADRPAPGRLLGLAAAAGLAARVGRTTRTDVRSSARPAPPPDDLPECSAAAAALWRRTSAAGSQFDVRWCDLSSEWITACARAGQRLPHDLLTDVLGKFEGWTRRAGPVRAVLGARGRWLAARNPRWDLFADLGDAEALWETGTRAERLALLERLRTDDPDRARRLVASTFAAEPAALRFQILRLLDVNLGAADGPLLEAAYDDRSDDVRGQAVVLLSKLAGSSLVARMADRARAALRWEGGKLAITLPPEHDESLQRDGIYPGGTYILGGKSITGPLRALYDILDQTPPALIAAHLGQSVAAIIAAARKTKQAAVILAGWEGGAVRFGDRDWCRALALVRVEERTAAESNHFADLFATLDRDHREALFAERVHFPLASKRDADEAEQYIAESDGDFSIEFGRRLVRQIIAAIVTDEAEAAIGSKHGRQSRLILGGLVDHTVERLPFDLIGEARALAADALTGAPVGAPDVSTHSRFLAALDRWEFRRSIHQEFSLA